MPPLYIFIYICVTVKRVALWRSSDFFRNLETAGSCDTNISVSFGVNMWTVLRIQLELNESNRNYHDTTTWKPQYDGEVPVMLELRGMRSTPLLQSLPAPFRPWVVAPDRILAMCQIELNCVLMLNWIIWNGTFLDIETVYSCSTKLFDIELFSYPNLNCLIEREREREKEREREEERERVRESEREWEYFFMSDPGS